MDIIVIGGGASGLAAAVSASEAGARVTVLEKEDRPGKKILATGNGRCNLMNEGEPRYFHGEDTAKRVLGSDAPARLRAFFASCGLRVMSSPEEDGRVYPATGQAASVLDVLRSACARRGVRILTGAPADGILPREGVFLVRTAGERFRADRVIVSCGSPAGVRGGEGAYGLLTALGHRMVPLVPALCPLECDMRRLGALKGLRVPAAVTLLLSGRPAAQSGGEILFGDRGISGIAAMQLAADAAEGMERGPEISLDLSPLLDIAPRDHFRSSPGGEPFRRPGDAAALLSSRLAFLPREDLLTGLVPRVLAQVLDRDRPDIAALARRLTGFRLGVTGVRSAAAQVMRGGIDTADIDPLTLESRLVPGLYCTGEMLDVDGDCGGYNLMFAFLSGIAAGHAASRARTGD